MLIPFDDMPESARIWIYQSNRPFSAQDKAIIHAKAEQFFKQWAAHGNPLKNSFRLFHDQFLVIAVDEQYNQASGCSIDASVNVVRQLEKELNIDFFDRTRVCFMADGKIFDAPMSNLKTLINAGQLKQTTLTFNNLIESVADLNEKWLVPAEESWLKRYF